MKESARLAEALSPLIRLEIASIGAIQSATIHEPDAGYVMLFHEAKTSKQASVEQMNTVLRMARQTQVESGGLIEPVLRLQTLGLQKASTTVLLGAMRLIENVLLDRYADACEALEGLERTAVEGASHRARIHWMILTAHIAQRKDGESSHAHELALPLSHYFAGDADHVCMRCLLDRPGAKPAIEKENPYTYICAACRTQMEAEFPLDLQNQMHRWRRQQLEDRVIHKALSRPMKLKAVKEIHTVLAGLPREIRPAAAKVQKAIRSESAQADRRTNGEPASELSLPLDGSSPGEASYVSKLFDYRSVRKSW